MKKLLCVIFALSLIFAFAGISYSLEKDILTRGDFFELIAKALLLDPSEKPKIEFLDYDSSREYINAMINENYLLGKNTGLLALEDELTLEDVEFLLSRVDLSPKIETKVEVKTEKDIVPFPIPIVIPYDGTKLKHSCKSESEHLYQLNHGEYTCIYCKAKAPVAATVLYASNAATDMEIIQLPYQESKTGYFDSQFAMFIDSDDNGYSIGYNAACFENEVNSDSRIGFAEMFRKYEGKNCTVKFMLGNEIDEDDGYIRTILITSAK